MNDNNPTDNNPSQNSPASNDDQKDKLLDFLTDNIFGRERDAVTRAFYEYAQGDPNSYPVGMAVLLTACTRKMASLPRNLRDSSTEFCQRAEEVTRMQQDLLEKLQVSHAQIFASFKDESASVIAAFKDENARANDIWRQTVQELLRLLDSATKIKSELAPVLVSRKADRQEVQTLQGNFNVHMQAVQRITESVETLKGVHNEAKVIHAQNQSLVYGLTNDARANWLTLGLIGGMCLVGTFSFLPWWG